MTRDQNQTRPLILSVTLAYGAAGWLALVDQGFQGDLRSLAMTALGVTVVGSLALPPVLAAVVLLRRLFVHRGDISVEAAVTATAVVFPVVALHVLHAAVFGTLPTEAPVVAVAGREVLVALPATLVLSAGVLAVMALASRRGAASTPPVLGPAVCGRPVGRLTGTVAGALALLVAATGAPASAVPAPAPTAATAGGVCSAANRTIRR